MPASLRAKLSVTSYRRLGVYSAAAPLPADEVLEFHAARLLLLLRIVGRGKLDGLTKLAKLDFFVRYPVFFGRAVGTAQPTGATESSMIRFHYGPWDKRYYQLLGYLGAKDLVEVSQPGPRTYRFALTAAGQSVAQSLEQDPAFTDLVERMQRVRVAFGSWSGSRLKNHVYATFRREVGQAQLGERIQP
jgi:hypothetical protein